MSKQKYIFIFYFLLIFIYNNAYCIPYNYKGNDNNYHEVSMVTSLDSSGSPIVKAYKDNNDNWKVPLVITEICGNDKQNKPVVCPNIQDILSKNLNDYIKVSQIGKTNGIAGLNNLSKITNEISSIGNSEFYDKNGYPVISINPSQNDPSKPYQNTYSGGNLLKPHALVVTGARVGLPNTEEDHNANGQIYLTGQMDGPDGLGCLLCIINTENSLPDTMPGISGGLNNWANGASGIATYPDADSPMEYFLEGQNNPVLTLQVDSYTTDEVVLKNPLTNDQKNRIHYGMYLITNSIDSNIPFYGFSSSSNLPLPNYFASVVDHVIDSTHISVKGWAVPGNNNKNIGQIPNTKSIDSYWTNFQDSSGKLVPTIGVGEPTNTSHINWVFDYENTKGSWLRNYENEIDIINNSGIDGRLRTRGLTMTYQGNSLPSLDSWGLRVNTAPMPVDLWLDVGEDKIAIKSDPFFIHGNKGVNSKNDTWIMGENDAFADSAQNMRLTSWLTQDTEGNDYNSVSLSLGLMVNGNQGEYNTPQSKITFDPLFPGNQKNTTGAMALSGFSGVGFGIDANSNSLLAPGKFLQFQQSDWTQGNVAPIIQAHDASHLYVRDTGGNGIVFDSYKINSSDINSSTGEFSSNISVSGNISIQSKEDNKNSIIISSASNNEISFSSTLNDNVTVSAGHFKSALHTPMSSTEPCTQGEAVDDMNFHYVCISDNKWRRVALEDF
ncbi:hypothetical protein JRX38_15220 [Gluconobacter cerinus]|uniref:hypothetical protein n=1 Tax=Gluconobacter cerinus TaxID=38307 RepID=UPI00193F4813|nr:hypothetical protein [Gluconobacter cerinus]MBM3099327.1 hypothetical protein [Gluconobacter cerinus]